MAEKNPVNHFDRSKLTWAFLKVSETSRHNDKETQDMKTEKRILNNSSDDGLYNANNDYQLCSSVTRNHRKRETALYTNR